jgi:predicted TIM-barrel fold metal-dependent hydrolase
MNIQQTQSEPERIPVIDVDFHPMPRHTDAQVSKFLSPKWQSYISKYGLGQGSSSFTGSPAQREFTHRLDAVDPQGRVGFDPLWCKKQVLDEYDLTAAILTGVSPMVPCGPNSPLELSLALNRAFNDSLAEVWLTSDSRYHAGITVARDLPGIAAEIKRCKEGPFGNRFVEVLMAPSGHEPLGKQRYWPIFEACVEYDIPLACHVPGTGHKVTAGGAPNFYCELHMNLVAHPMTMLPSLIFEGVFDHFPTLKIALIELGWSWVPAFAWRMDSVYKKLKGEVPHLKKKPSEYLRDHFFFATQPVEEPEKLKETEAVYRMFEETGLGENLMYSSDYPHWDFDAPYDSISSRHPIERRRRILGENASKLFKIPLKPNSGILASARTNSASAA